MKTELRSADRGTLFTVGSHQAAVTIQEPIQDGRHTVVTSHDSGSIEHNGHRYDTAAGWQHEGYQTLAGASNYKQLHLTHPNLDGHVVLYRDDQVRPAGTNAQQLLVSGFELPETVAEDVSVPGI